MKLPPFFSTFQTLSKRSTRAFLLCAALWVGLSASISRADDLISVEDLSSEEFEQLASFSAALRAATSTPASGNITNDVAAILAILQQYANITSTGFATYPRGTAGLNLSRYLWSALFDASGNDGTPNKANSFLSKIYLSLKALDFGYTNVLSSIDDHANDIYLTAYDINSQLSGHLTYLTHLTDLGELSYLNPIFTNQVAFADWISDFEYGQGSQWGVHLDDTQFGDLMNQLINGNVSLTNAISGPQDTWDDMYDVFVGIEQYLKTIHEDDFDFDGGGDRSLRLDLGYWNAQDQTRSIAEDLRFLHRQIGVENPSARNNIFSVLRSLASLDSDGTNLLESVTNAVEQSASSARSSASNAFASAESNVQNVASNSVPDFEQHSYGSTNPYSELDGLASAAKRQFENALPDIPDATDSTIVLFRGNMPLLGGRSNTRSGGSSVYLDISYPLRDWDAVSGGLSTMNGIMEVVWDLVALGLILWMYKRFYDDIMSGNFEKGVEQ